MGIDFEYPYGATPLDPEEIEGLKLPHITTMEELNRWEQSNISEAYSWLKKRRNQKDVTNQELLLKLHKQMFGKVWKWAGQFRRSEKNIGVSWPTIQVELNQHLADINYWIEHKTYSPDEIGIRFHHKLVWIHLFSNGNGRHARLATDALLENVFEIKPFTWGKDSIDRPGDVRSGT